MFVEAALKNAGTDFDLLFLYKVPKHIIDIFPGTIIKVPFGNRKNAEAIVVNILLCDNVDTEYEIKDVISVVSSQLKLSSEMQRILKWMKQRYFCTYYDILRLMLPLSLPLRKKSMKTAFLSIDEAKAIELIANNEFTNIKHIRVLENLIENDFLPVAELCSLLSISPSVLRTLEKKGYIQVSDRTYERIPDMLKQDVPYFRPLLNDEQNRVVNELKDKIGRFSSELIYGVTGSGKTEVFLRCIQAALENGKNSLILVPEIALTPQMVSTLSGRFQGDIAIIHSKLSPGQRFDSWSKISEKKVKIVVGARSAVFAPLENIGLIVIDEEHDTSYKSETTPKYNVKDIAKKRAIANDALLISGSATPSIESYFAAKTKNKLHTLLNRAATDKMPEVILVDMKRELKNGNNSMLSSFLIDGMKKTLSRNEKVMLLLNRRGFNNILLCQDCKNVYNCINCSVSMKYHKDLNRLVCHHCGYTISADECRYCKSKNLVGIGYGTQYIEMEIQKLFPKIPLYRLDADTQARYKANLGIMDSFKAEDAAILVGTQLIAKGHDIEEVTLVGILNADMTLTSDDFRASERTFSLISQIVGRAGRGKLDGRAVIQSLETEDYSITNAVANDYTSFYSDEIKIRKMMGYPPFKKIALIELRASDKEALDRRSEEIGKWIRDTINDCEVIGPYDPYINILSGNHRVRFLIKGTTLKTLVEGLLRFDGRYGKKIRRSCIILSIDIDPYQILM